MIIAQRGSEVKARNSSHFKRVLSEGKPLQVRPEPEHENTENEDLALENLPPLAPGKVDLSGYEPLGGEPEPYPDKPPDVGPEVPAIPPVVLVPKPPRPGHAMPTAPISRPQRTVRMTKHF